MLPMQKLLYRQRMFSGNNLLLNVLDRRCKENAVAVVDLNLLLYWQTAQWSTAVLTSGGTDFTKFPDTYQPQCMHFSVQIWTNYKNELRDLYFQKVGRYTPQASRGSASSQSVLPNSHLICTRAAEIND